MKSDQFLINEKGFVLQRQRILCYKFYRDKISGRVECGSLVDLEGISRFFQIPLVVLKIGQGTMCKQIVEGRTEMADISFFDNCIEWLKPGLLQQLLVFY